MHGFKRRAVNVVKPQTNKIQIFNYLCCRTKPTELLLKMKYLYLKESDDMFFAVTTSRMPKTTAR